MGTSGSTNINLKTFWNLTDESLDDVKEFAGNVYIVKKDGIYHFLPSNTMKGGVKSVSLPNGHAFHSHPRLCKRLTNCSLQPPSADDMRIFSTQNNTQLVLTDDVIYMVRKYKSDKTLNPEKVFQYFRQFELYFDRVKKGAHDMYQDLWENACILCNWFIIYKFHTCKEGVYKAQIDDYALFNKIQQDMIK